MGTTRLLMRGGAGAECRFTTSPLWETVNAARIFVDPRSRQYLLPWWEAVRDRPPAAELLLVLQAYPPDFLRRPPAGAAPHIEAQLDGLRATSPELVVEELTRCRDARTDRRGRERLGAMLADPERTRDRLADQIADAWLRLVLPWWPWVRGVIDADTGRRSRLLAERGLGQVISGLHECVRWKGDAVEVRSAATGTRELTGDGLVLMPSVFVGPGVAVMAGGAWHPALVFPARGAGRLLGGKAGAPAALARLLGRTRALLLTDLAVPVATGTLALRHDLSASTVSAHLTALHDAGLTVRRRHGHEVRYHRTALGDALLAGVVPGEWPGPYPGRREIAS